MSKDASSRTNKSAHKTVPNSPMQRYLRYLKSDSKPVPEEEQFPAQSRLGVWRPENREQKTDNGR